MDLLIRGGHVIDGTGAPARRADIGVSDGRIVGIGKLGDHARRVMDADGRVVCPGFVDVHTHYDAQLFWDATLSPSPLHGATTVIAGNCGISLAPTRESDHDFLVRMLSRVEAIPVETLLRGVDFRWHSFEEFLSAAEQAQPVINVGFLVGHSALRRSVMGPAASSDAATEAEIAAMRHAASRALAAGALGFSSSKAATQLDGDGRPTPPNFATDQELVALAGCCRSYPGTSVEYIPASAAYGFDQQGRDVALMARMSRAARRHVNWNTVLLHYPGKPDIQDQQLASADQARDQGGLVVPMIIPHNFRVRTDFLDSDVGFRSLPGFAKLFELPYAARVAALADPAFRGRLVASLDDAAQGANVMFRDAIDHQVVSDVGPASMANLVGRPVVELAAERGVDVLTLIFDLAVESDLEIGFVRHLVPVATAEERALRRRVLRDPRLVLGASDGGAHLRGVQNVEYSTASFAELVRDDHVFSIEELVQEFTDVPARLYGLRGRGRIRVGAVADLVIFDKDEIRASPVSMQRDLPGGAARLFSRGLGIDSVLVRGQEVVREGAYTGTAAGQVLRSGRDTATTPSHLLLRRRRSPCEG
jgi:N-acyl-D-aspartate/D-glutamate deacylase